MNKRKRLESLAVTAKHSMGPTANFLLYTEFLNSFIQPMRFEINCFDLETVSCKTFFHSPTADEVKFIFFTIEHIF